MSREVAANGGAKRYRAALADHRAGAWATRPKQCKLVENPLLRHRGGEAPAAVVSQQIAGWLNVTHPEGPEMQVSHESICRSLYAQSRWALPKELTRSIRTGR